MSTSKEIVCCELQTPCFSENKNTQKLIHNTRKCSLRHATNARFSNFRGTRPKKMPYFFRFLPESLGKTTLVQLVRTVSTMELIRGKLGGVGYNFEFWRRNAQACKTTGRTDTFRRDRHIHIIVQQLSNTTPGHDDSEKKWHFSSAVSEATHDEWTIRQILVHIRLFSGIRRRN